MVFWLACKGCGKEQRLDLSLAWAFICDHAISCGNEKGVATVTSVPVMILERWEQDVISGATALLEGKK